MNLPRRQYQRAPMGHQPTREEEVGHGIYGTPFTMHLLLARESENRLEATYTHTSRHEIDRWGETFERRFHRAAFDPFDIPPSMRASFIEDGHVVLRVRMESRE